MLSQYKDIINVKEFCEILNIGQSKAYELLATNQIKHIKVGRVYKIPKAAILEMFDALTSAKQRDILDLNNERYSISKERGAI